MARNITQEERDEIIRLYVEEKLSQREIQEKKGYAIGTIHKWTKGLRSRKDGLAAARKNGRWQISEEGKTKLSEAGKKLCRTTGKFWTKPEREFRNLLKEMGFGVKLPDYVKEIYKETDDDDGIILYQYPLQRYVCDFVCPEKSVVFNVNGDFWHANPILYDQNNLTKIQKHNAKQDRNKKIFLEKNGWIVIDVWESDIYWRTEEVKKLVQASISIGRVLALHASCCGFESHLAYSDWSDRLKELWFKKPKGRPKKTRISKDCKVCGSKFEVIPSHDKKRKTCSKKCQRINQQKVSLPSKENLSKGIKEMSWLALGKKYGVSDNAVRKWARKYELI